MAPATIAWTQEAIARDRRINQAIEHEWRPILAQSERIGHNEPWPVSME